MSQRKLYFSQGSFYIIEDAASSAANSATSVLLQAAACGCFCCRCHRPKYCSMHLSHLPAARTASRLEIRANTFGEGACDVFSDL